MKNSRHAISRIDIRGSTKIRLPNVCLYHRKHKVLLCIMKIFVRVQKFLHNEILHSYEILRSIDLLHKTYTNTKYTLSTYMYIQRKLINFLLDQSV